MKILSTKTELMFEGNQDQDCNLACRRAGDHPVIRVVHCKEEPYDIYIGRPSKWRNPFRLGVDARSRDHVIQLYERWIQTQPELMAALPELRGKILGCWCAPKRCHGEVLKRLAEQDLTLFENNERG